MGVSAWQSLHVHGGRTSTPSPGHHLHRPILSLQPQFNRSEDSVLAMVFKQAQHTPEPRPAPGIPHHIHAHKTHPLQTQDRVKWKYSFKNAEWYAPFFAHQIVNLLYLLAYAKSNCLMSQILQDIKVSQNNM